MSNLTVSLFGKSKTSKQKYTLDRIAVALIKGGGYVSYAARILKCSPRTIRKYLSDFPQLRDLIEDIKEHQLDTTEVALLKKIEKGDNTAILFHLKCLGKKRGFIDTPINLHAEVDPNSATWQQLMEAAGLEDEKDKNGQSCDTPSDS
jgi:hypothetical protein